MGDDSRAIVCDGGQQTAAGDIRHHDTPPDEEQDRGQDTAVAQPRECRVRGDATVTTDTFVANAPDEVPVLDFSPSSTAIDPEDARQDRNTDQTVGRFAYTPNATFINEDIPAQSDIAATLNQLNRQDAHDSDTHTEAARRTGDLRRDVQAWGETVGLTDTECAAAVEIVTATPTGVRRNFGLETVCLGALTIAANQPTHGPHTAKSIRLRGPDTDTPTLVTRYERLREDLGVSRQRVSDFRTWYNRNHS